MFNYIVKRLLVMIPTIFGITIISFIVIHLAPGNPAELLEQQGGQIVQKSKEVSFETVDEFRRRYNLDKPLHIQYIMWLKKVITFDFGESITHNGKSVNSLLAEAIPITLLLSTISILIIYIIAIPLGVYTSVKENTIQDKIITLILFMLYSLPSFFVAIWLLNLLASEQITQEFILGLPIRLFPAQGLSLDLPIISLIEHLILPITCMTFAGYAYLARQMRGGMLEVLRQDYIRTARAKGLSEKTVVLKHALRNSLIPIITIAGSILPALIGGNIIIEKIFDIPGMGRLSFNAIYDRDYNVVMAVFYLSSVLTLLGILIVDIIYVVINPRISFD